jgi:hypothetical protein
MAMNREELSRQGYLYPFSGIYWKVNHHNIVFQLRHDPRYSPDAGGIAELVEEISDSNASRVIVSAEDFCFCDETEINELNRTLAKVGKVKVVAYIRRQDKWLQSRFAQITKFGHFREDFTASLVEGLDAANFYRRLEPWAKAVKTENVIVRVLEKQQLVSGNVCIDFLHACGIQSVERFEYPQDQNISPSIKTLNIIRYITDVLRDNRIVGERIGTAANYIRKYADEHEWNDERLMLVTPELFERIMSHLEADNRRLAQKYLKRDSLFMELFVEEPITDFDVESIHVAELADVMAYVMARMLRDERKNADES